MSIRCDDCGYLFSKKRSSCPFCGGNIIQDDRPDADLLAAGFTMAPQGRQQAASNDPFAAMRQAYEQEQRQTSSVPTPPPVQEPKEPDRPQGGVDFFSQFQGGAPSTGAVPTVGSTYQSPQEQAPTRQPDPYEAELRELERQQRRLDRQYRCAAFWNRLSSLRWGMLFRVIVVLLVVVSAIGLWNMRYTILNSVLDFLISLLPIALIIWGIWLLVRSIFR